MAKTNDDIVTKDLLSKSFKVFREELNEDFERIATNIKSDFFDKIDPILKEVVASREERAIFSEKISNHSDRLQKLENTVFKN